MSVASYNFLWLLTLINYDPLRVIHSSDFFPENHLKTRIFSDLRTIKVLSCFAGNFPSKSRKAAIVKANIQDTSDWRMALCKSKG